MERWHRCEEGNWRRRGGGGNMENLWPLGWRGGRGRGYTDHNFDFILLLWRIFKPRTIISLPLLFAPKYMNITPKFVITGNWCYIGNFWLKSGWNGFYLEHQQNRIQHDESHDEVLEGGRLHEPPQFILVTIALLQGLQRGFSWVVFIFRVKAVLLCRPLS